MSLPAWPTLIKARQRSREWGLIAHIFPVFLHPRTLLWSVCKCLRKNTRRLLLPSVFCVVLTVQCGRGMFAINIQLAPNEGAKLKSHSLRHFSAGFERTNVSPLLISSGVAEPRRSQSLFKVQRLLLKNLIAWP